MGPVKRLQALTPQQLLEWGCDIALEEVSRSKHPVVTLCDCKVQIASVQLVPKAVVVSAYSFVILRGHGQTVEIPYSDQLRKSNDASKSLVFECQVAKIQALREAYQFLPECFELPAVADLSLTTSRLAETMALFEVFAHAHQRSDEAKHKASGRQATPSGSTKPTSSESKIAEEDNKKIREKAAGKLFKQRPSVEQKVMMSPVSLKWQQEGRLDFHDVLPDGFAARYSKELLVIDAHADQLLNKFVDQVEAGLSQRRGQLNAILYVSDMIQRAFGGLGRKVPEAFQKRIVDLNLRQGDSLLIGARGWDLLEEAEGEQGSEMSGATAGFLGSGMCRHRSLLFKYVVRRLKVCESAAISGVIVPNDCENVSQFRRDNGFADHAWNIVRLNGQNYLLDIMNTPHELQSLNSADGEKVQMKVQGTSYVYYRFDGGSGISLAYSPGAEESSETQTETESLDSEDDLELDPDSEEILQLQTVGPAGHVMVKFDLRMQGRTWQARKTVHETALRNAP
eukprot:g2168.t1